MRIYSMTATFGKLQNETLTLKPGLNIIEAPNEWGKSTWCAFLVAMLYGIDSRAHSATKAGLADKTRFDPWSGQPMSGRMELCWNGRDITIERSSTKRSQLRQFRAFETATGAAIPELNGDNCGQLLLGAEKEVFQRAGFLRLSDLPVTPNEALRRRLNALVTTGDESGAADKLSQQLNKLKNEIRANRSHGLLPQAEAQREQLTQKLRSLQELQEHSQKLKLQQQSLEEFQTQLQNHRVALQYEAAQKNHSRMVTAKEAEATALEALESLESQCAALPDMEAAQKEVSILEQLQAQMLSIQMESRMLPLPPEPPAPPAGGETDPEKLAIAITAHRNTYNILQKKLAKKRFPLWAPGLLVLLATVGLLFLHPVAACCAGIMGLGIIILDLILAGKHRRQRTLWESQAKILADTYKSPDPTLWASAATKYQTEYAQYSARLEQHQNIRQELERREDTLNQTIANRTAGKPLEVCLQQYRSTVVKQQQLADARREHQRCISLTQTLLSVYTDATPPSLPDTLTHSESDTSRLLSDCASELKLLHLKQGHCQGQMEALGQEAELQRQLTAVQQRIGHLETTLAALTLAQETLSAATAQLQRRFAPRIAGQARELFARLTCSRYDRLSLAEDLSLHVGAQGEDILRSVLWRSDGTADQLYLALRLAVARELTPDAPLVLDDALVRFDDDRLRIALEVLQEEAQNKQVLLFTCQSREQRMLTP